MNSTLSEGEFRRRLAFTLGVPLLVMMICGASLVLITNHLLYLMQLSRSNLNIINELRASELLLLDIEAGNRGFKMTGESTFLDACSQEKAALNQHLATLANDVATDQDKRVVDDLRETTNKWQDSEAKAVSEGKYDSSPKALADELDRKTLMEGVKQKMDSFLDTKEQARAEYRLEVDSTKGYVILAEMITLILVMVLTGFHVWRQMSGLSTYYERTVREIANQKERFRVTLSSIGDAVIVTDINGQAAFMNAEAERLTGWQWDEAKGQALSSIFKIVDEQSRSEVEDPVKKVFKEKRVMGLANHTLLLSRAGTEWPIEDSAAPIYDSRGGMVGVVLVFHDATEIRKAGRLLKTYAEELEQKVKERTGELQRTISELEAFSYTISHDLRAPLRAMQGYSTALLEDYSHGWGADERELMGRIQNAAERLDVLIQDVLTYSKVSKEHQPIEPINLERLIDDILTQYPTFQNAKARFEVRRPIESVLGHPSGLTQAVSNLLTNAVKFIPSDRPAEIKVWAESKGLTLRLWIEDNGIGIDPTDHERIFKMFEQVNGKRFEGTGMGLAIARKAVENMQGRIGVESRLEHGTKMWIELLKSSAQ